LEERGEAASQNVVKAPTGGEVGKKQDPNSNKEYGSTVKKNRGKGRTRESRFSEERGKTVVSVIELGGYRGKKENRGPGGKKEGKGPRLP